MKQLKSHVNTLAKPSDDVVIAGDFNIAPADIDVWDPAALVGSTHVSEPERSALKDLCQWGLKDVFRDQHPEPQLYSWWDYRGVAFFKNQGLRIDHILVSESLKPQVKGCSIDRTPRKWKQPTDHAPVTVEI